MIKLIQKIFSKTRGSIQTAVSVEHSIGLVVAYGAVGVFASLVLQSPQV